MSDHIEKYLEIVQKLQENGGISIDFLSEYSNKIMEMINEQNISSDDACILLKLIGNDMSSYVEKLEKHETAKETKKEEKKEAKKEAKKEEYTSIVYIDNGSYAPTKCVTHYFDPSDKDVVLKDDGTPRAPWKERRVYTLKDELIDEYKEDKAAWFPAVTAFYPNGDIKAIMYYDYGKRKNPSPGRFNYHYHNGDFHVTAKKDIPATTKYGENEELEYISTVYESKDTYIEPFNADNVIDFHACMTRDTTCSKSIYYGENYDIHFNEGYQTSRVSIMLKWYRTFYDSGYILDQYFYTEKGIDCCTVRYSTFGDTIDKHKKVLYRSRKEEHQPYIYRVINNKGNSVMKPHDDDFITFTYINKEGDEARKTLSGPARFDAAENSILYSHDGITYDENGHNVDIENFKERIKRKGLTLSQDIRLKSKSGIYVPPPYPIVVRYWLKKLVNKTNFYNDKGTHA